MLTAEIDFTLRPGKAHLGFAVVEYDGIDPSEWTTAEVTPWDTVFYALRGAVENLLDGTFESFRQWDCECQDGGASGTEGTVQFQYREFTPEGGLESYWACVSCGDGYMVDSAGDYDS